VEPEVREWLFKLQDEKRLVIALKAFKAMDQQMQIGANVREVVGQVLREILYDFSILILLSYVSYTIFDS